MQEEEKKKDQGQKNPYFIELIGFKRLDKCMKKVLNCRARSG